MSTDTVRRLTLEPYALSEEVTLIHVHSFFCIAAFSAWSVAAEPASLVEYYSRNLETQVSTSVTTITTLSRKARAKRTLMHAKTLSNRTLVWRVVFPIYGATLEHEHNGITHHITLTV
jgi:hypothetical protein